MLPESAVRHPWATKRCESVAEECRVTPSGSEKVRKCRLRVSCGTLGQRKVAEMLPESAVRHPWATKGGGNVTGECRAAPLGNEEWRKCRRRVLRGILGQRKVAEMLPESVVRHPWATKSGGSVAGDCCAAPLGNEEWRKCRRRVLRGTLGQRKGAKVSPKSVLSGDG